MSLPKRFPRSGGVLPASVPVALGAVALGSSALPIFGGASELSVASRMHGGREGEAIRTSGSPSVGHAPSLLYAAPPSRPRKSPSFDLSFTPSKPNEAYQSLNQIGDEDFYVEKERGNRAPDFDANGQLI